MSGRKKIKIAVRGIVQGVGFRPFLHRLAEKYDIAGWACNTSGGVEAELEGGKEALDAFLAALRTEAPPLAVVEEILVEDEVPKPPFSCSKFVIRESRLLREATLVSPDIAVCPDCRRELMDPRDRRFGYPFINCTSCGPRYTIIKSLPYDRKRTSMEGFSMCPACEEEYGDIRSRRYHAQPDCCPDCGPRAFYLARGQAALSDSGESITAAVRELARGGIVAVKGLGGIHLACDGENEAAVRRLRERKKRPGKPLAVMCSLEEAKRLCHVTEEERRLLESPRAPIVLLEKRDVDSLFAVSTGPRLGVMLPYTPLHLLLFKNEGCPRVLVMTSANRSGCPVLTEEEEALEALDDVADGFLFHNRPIENRCDDSLVMEWEGGPYFFRRSRGYAPQPIFSSRSVTGICALGAEQKASFALGREHHIFLSPHIGDLKNGETADHYETALETYIRLFQIEPQLFVCDLHPDYISSREARKLAEQWGSGKKGEKCGERAAGQAKGEGRLPVLPVQHHWAHLASCMEDNGLTGPVFGIIWDGTGLGTDGTVWGGEFLEGDFSGFCRRGSIRPISLAGGDRAMEEIGRIALSLLRDAGLSTEPAPLEEKKKPLLEALLASGTGCIPASSIGRLFDGVCSLLLGKRSVSYSGEGGALLEAVSARTEPQLTAAQSCHGMDEFAPYPVKFYWEEREEGPCRLFDTRPLICGVERDRQAGVMPGEIAARFMETLCVMAAKQCEALNTKGLPVVLSGGVFLNRFLLSGITKLLRSMGYEVYCHRRVSPGDEGLCLGQLAIGARYGTEIKREPDQAMQS